MRVTLVLCGLMLVAASALAAPPPPPPSLSEDVPAEIDGYSTHAIYSSYALWVNARMGEARALALEERPAQLEENYLRWDMGPSARSYNNEPHGATYGRDVRLHRWCAYDATQGRDCVWFAARVTNRHDNSEGFFAIEHFDAVRAVAFLRTNGVSPRAVTWRTSPQSFGLPDPLAWGAARYVDLRQVSEHDCAGVRQSLEAAERVSTALAVTSEEPPREEWPARPPPPHSGIVELTLPAWYARRAGAASHADIVIDDAGADSLVSRLVADIFDPVDACPQMQS